MAIKACTPTPRTRHTRGPVLFAQQTQQLGEHMPCMHSGAAAEEGTVLSAWALGGSLCEKKKSEPGPPHVTAPANGE